MIYHEVDEDWSGATVTIKGDDNGATDPEGDAITYYVVDVPSNGNIYNDGGGGVDALASGDELTSYQTIIIQMLTIMVQIHLLLKEVMEL